MTYKDAYWLPRIDDILEALRGANNDHTAAKVKHDQRAARVKHDQRAARANNNHTAAKVRHDQSNQPG